MGARERMLWQENDALFAALARWRSGDRGGDPLWTLRSLIKEIVGRYATPLDEASEVLGLTREELRLQAPFAADELRNAARDARRDRAENIRVHEGDFLERCAENIQRICALPAHSG